MGFTAPVQTYDGTVYMPIGGGYSATGSSIDVKIQEDIVMTGLAQLGFRASESKETILQNIQNLGEEVPAELDLVLMELFGEGAIIHVRNTGVYLLLVYTPKT